MNVGLIGKGYWGSIIESKINDPLRLIFSADSSTNYEPYLDNTDWVIVATPSHTHYAIVKEMLEYEIHVFCEKPFTETLEEATELIKLAIEKGVKLYVNNIFLHRKAYINFKTKLPKKHKLDKISFSWNKFGPFKDNLLNDLFYHDLYMLLDILGPIDTHDISLNSINSSENKYYLNCTINNLVIEFDYDREYKGEKIKTISVNDNILCDFSIPDNDPLSEMIYKVINEKSIFDFEKNLELTLNAKTLFEYLSN